MQAEYDSLSTAL